MVIDGCRRLYIVSGVVQVLEVLRGCQLLQRVVQGFRGCMGFRGFKRF